MKLDELVANYIKLRDKKSQLKKQYDEKVAKVDAVMDKMEAIILKTFQDSGIDSARTDAGTAYISTRTSASVASRRSFSLGCCRTPRSACRSWKIASTRQWLTSTRQQTTTCRQGSTIEAKSPSACAARKHVLH